MTDSAHIYDPHLNVWLMTERYFFQQVLLHNGQHVERGPVIGEDQALALAIDTPRPEAT